MRRVARAALGLVAASSLAAAAGACSNNCPGTTCVAPVFDLYMPPIDDLALVHDMAITTAGAVMIGGGGVNAFTPATLTIHAGDGVTWNWVSGFHSVVSDSTPKAFADSPAQASGQYVATFPDAGSFPYHCGIHGAMMSGTIVVQ